MQATSSVEVSQGQFKGREEGRTCYRLHSMLSITSNLIESCAASNDIDQVATRNLLDDRQWVYKKPEKLTEQLPIQITEKWRIAVDRKLLVRVLFVDFAKAFDTVPHNIFMITKAK